MRADQWHSNPIDIEGQRATEWVSALGSRAGSYKRDWSCLTGSCVRPRGRGNKQGPARPQGLAPLMYLAFQATLKTPPSHLRGSLHQVQRGLVAAASRQ